MRSITLLFLSLFVSIQLFAGKGEKVPGYIIKKNGERVEGEVVIGSITDNEVKVTFINRTGKKSNYKPKDLLGYGFESSETDELGLEETKWVHFERQQVDYPPKPFGPKTVFMEKEEDGPVQLYCYYVEVRNNPKQPYKYFYYVKDEQGNLTKLEKGSFAKTAKRLFKDYTAMYSRIGKKDFLYRNLDRMVRDYNYWMANQHDKTEYRVAFKHD